MRRGMVIGRIRKLAFALLACLAIAVLAPLYLTDAGLEEPFAVSSVVASPRDMHILSAPVQLSEAPNLILNRGTVYAYGSTASSNSTAAGNSIVLDGAVFTFNAGARASPAEAAAGVTDPNFGPAPVIEQLANLGFDLISLRRGTVNITGSDGAVIETLMDVQAEITGRRKGLIAGRGTFMVRGQRVAFDATVGQSTDKKLPLRWPIKATLSGNLLEANIEGHADVTDDVQLTGAVDMSSPSLRRIGRWFGLPLHTTEGFNATSVKAQFSWARQFLAFEKAKVVVDGNEANGRLALNLAGERPLLDATLDFTALNITPYVEATKVPFFGIDLPATSWSSFDFSLPLIRYVDADLRISARKTTFKDYTLGAAGATITAQAGKLQADLTELELNSGMATAQVTAIMTEAMPRYALRGKVENIDAAAATTLWFGTPILAGRATLTADLTTTGYSPTEIIKRLSGKASISLAEGRAALDLAALRDAAKKGDGSNWRGAARSYVGLDQLEGRTLIIDGVAFADSITARSNGMGLGASGRFGLADGNMDVRVMMKSSVPADKPLQMGDLSGGDALTLRGPWQDPAVRMEGSTADGGQ